jgi:hypothetical protein
MFALARPIYVFGIFGMFIHSLLHLLRRLVCDCDLLK